MTAATAPGTRPPTTTPMTTGTTNTRGGVATLRWARNGTITANSATCPAMATDGAENSSPLRPGEGMHASHRVGHVFPGDKFPATECTDDLDGPGEASDP